MSLPRSLNSVFIVLVLFTILQKSWAQYNPGNYNQNNYGPQNQMYQQQANAIDNSFEQKYVNSGQSVMLVCDLPNNMPDGKVLFVKYDSKVLSSGLNIIDEIDDDRFEIGQQYAWEWSLKINAINEDDAGIYFCKVGYTTIKQYEIIVRVPPRIRDDGNGGIKKLHEGDDVQLACFATGTPKPNITWFTISAEGNSLIPMQETGSYLNIKHVSRATPRRYQCRASNYIPPSDTKNFTLSIEFAPEIIIESKPNLIQNSMELNCTIHAFPLTNRNFWRKDGTFLQDSIKTEIKNIRVNEFTLISQLKIKYFNDLDQGLYECTAENDLRVSKMVYTLKSDDTSNANKLMPIGYSNNNYRKKLDHYSAQVDTSTPSDVYPRRKLFKHRLNHQRPNDSEDEDEDKLLNRKYFRNRKMKKLRFHNQAETTPVDANVVSSLPETTNSYNSPYIILLDEGEYEEQKQRLFLQTTTVRQSFFNSAPCSYCSNFYLRVLPLNLCIFILTRI